MQKWTFQIVDSYTFWLPFCPILTGYKRHCWLYPHKDAERNMFCGLWIRLSSGCVAFCWFCINDAQQTLHSPYIDIHNFAVSGCYRGTCFYLYPPETIQVWLGRALRPTWKPTETTRQKSTAWPTKSKTCLEMIKDTRPSPTKKCFVPSADMLDSGRGLLGGIKNHALSFVNQAEASQWLHVSHDWPWASCSSSTSHGLQSATAEENSDFHWPAQLLGEKFTSRPSRKTTATSIGLLNFPARNSRRSIRRLA